MQSENARLVHLCLGGDTGAFGRLVDLYQSAVYATAYYYVGRHGAAEDIAQESFLQAYKSLRRLKDPSSFGPWLREITCRTAANWLRRNESRMQNEAPLPVETTLYLEDARQGPDAALERAERFDRVMKAIEALPERYRPIVVLRYLQELSYKEISEFTGDSVDEVRGILQRASRQLRDELIDEENEGSEGQSQWPRAQK